MTLKEVTFSYLNHTLGEYELELVDYDFSIIYYINPRSVDKARYIARRHLKLYNNAEDSSWLFCAGAINVLNTYLARNLNVVKNMYLYIYYTRHMCHMSIEERIKYHELYLLYEYNINGYSKQLLDYHNKYKLLV